MAKPKADKKATNDSVPIEKEVSSDVRNVNGDVISISHVGKGAAVAAGRGASASVQDISSITGELAQWRSQMLERVEQDPNLSVEDKADAKIQIEKIKSEVSKGKDADPGRIEKLVNILSVMASDIFEVALATLANPLAGLGLVIKKVGDKAIIENTPKS